MKVGASVEKAISDWLAGHGDAAMLHACNAIDGTAGKLFPTLGNNARFTRLLRENYDVFGPMALPGIDLVNTRFPVKVQHPKAPGGLPDIADLVYGIHRCTHGHGDDLPEGFQLLEDAKYPDGGTRLTAVKGAVQLSDRTIFGLLAVAVLSPVNLDQSTSDGFHLTFAKTVFIINDWWGRKDDFLKAIANHHLPRTTLDFGDWMDIAK